MSRTIFLISLLIISLSISDCSKSPLCWGEDKNKGIIVSSVDFGICYFHSEDENFIINDDNELDSLYSVMQEPGSECIKPEIDFEKYTLLGQYATGGCKVKFIREVLKDIDNKQYIYSIRVRSCGTCKSLRLCYNWVLVPKLPEGWNVKFEIFD